MSESISNIETLNENKLLGRAPSAKQKYRILFVDDDERLLRVFSGILKKLDLDVDLAVSAREGLWALSENEYAVVISDYRMPEMDGIRFLEKVKAQQPDTVCILSSGNADFDTAIEAINQLQLFRFLVKPWEAVELRNTIARAFEHYSVKSENRQLNEALTDRCSDLDSLNSTLKNLNQNLETKVHSRTENLLLGLTNALDLRDTETQWHSRRVARYSKRLARELEIGGDRLLDVERGALLHDVGKIGVSDTILLKPAKLTDAEWVEMRNHSEYGYRILEGITFLGDAREIVWQHHERWDGAGYPRKLKGLEICIGARIFAIIDTYDAITSNRPYRKAMSHQAALTEINKMIGTQFDPEIVDAWNRISADDIIGLRECKLEMQESKAG